MGTVFLLSWVKKFRYDRWDWWRDFFGNWAQYAWPQIRISAVLIQYGSLA
jgi:hypothetical protein